MQIFSFKNKNVTVTQFITIIGLLSAIGAVLDAYLIIPIFSSWMKVTFGYIPEAIAAVLLGPYAAIATATISDIFSTLLRGGDFSFLFVWLAVLQGTITGIILNRRLTLKRIVINRVAVNLIVNLFFNTLLLDYMGLISWRIRIPLQLIKCPIGCAFEIILLSVILPAIINSVRRFGFHDIYVEENISITSFSDFKRRFVFPILEAFLSLATMLPLILPLADMTFNGKTESFYYFLFFGKLFNGDVKLDFYMLAIMMLPILLTTTCFVLSFSKKCVLKVVFGILNVLSLAIILEAILKQYLNGIDHLKIDFSGAAVIAVLYGVLAIGYVAVALLQRRIEKSERK